MKYRKKPVVIEAQHIEWYQDIEKIAQWCGGVPAQDRDGPAYMNIPTLEGIMRAEVGDWIIQGVKGEFYPCKPDVFDATYEPVEVSA